MKLSYKGARTNNSSPCPTMHPKFSTDQQVHDKPVTVSSCGIGPCSTHLMVHLDKEHSCLIAIH